MASQTTSNQNGPGSELECWLIAQIIRAAVDYQSAPEDAHGASLRRYLHALESFADYTIARRRGAEIVREEFQRRVPVDRVVRRPVLLRNEPARIIPLVVPQQPSKGTPHAPQVDDAEEDFGFGAA
jgi:hypothetical protein